MKIQAARNYLDPFLKTRIGKVVAGIVIIAALVILVKSWEQMTTSPGSLGVKIYGETRADGAMISHVLPNGPSGRVLQPTDVIQRFENEPVHSGHDLINLLQRKRSGEIVELVFYRFGTDSGLRKGRVRLGSKPDLDPLMQMLPAEIRVPKDAYEQLQRLQQQQASVSASSQTRDWRLTDWATQPPVKGWAPTVQGELARRLLDKQRTEDATGTIIFDDLPSAPLSRDEPGVVIFD